MFAIVELHRYFSVDRHGRVFGNADFPLCEHLYIIHEISFNRKLQSRSFAT